ncbi:MAG: NUDIX hydrolase [Eubacterium sp.]|nr:NUDIX hydrolase [Eubacterium sp.]
MSEYHLKNKRSVYQGNVMDFYECDIELPDGKTAAWDLVQHNGGAAVLPIDADGSLILIRQYRLGVDHELLELPAGKAEPGEDRLATVRREMEEEIGYVAKDIRKLLTFAPAPAYSEEVTDIFVATGLTQTESHPDADEFLQVERCCLEDVVAMIKNGEIIDGKTIAAVMTYVVMINN